MKNLEKRFYYQNDNGLVLSTKELIQQNAKKLFNKETTDGIIAEFDEVDKVINPPYGGTMISIGINDDNNGNRKIEIAKEGAFNSNLLYTEKVSSNNVVEYEVKINNDYSTPVFVGSYVHSCTGYHQMFDLGSRPSIKETIIENNNYGDMLFEELFTEAKYDDALIEYKHVEKCEDRDKSLDKTINVVDTKTLIKKSVNCDGVEYSKAELSKKESLPTANDGIINLRSFIDSLEFKTITEFEYNELLNKALESRYLMSDIDEVRNGESR